MILWRDSLPGLVSCARCGKVVVEAMPTRRRVVCAACVEAFVGGVDRCCVCDAELRNLPRFGKEGRVYCEECHAPGE